MSKFLSIFEGVIIFSGSQYSIEKVTLFLKNNVRVHRFMLYSFVFLIFIMSSLSSKDVSIKWILM